MYLFIVKSGGSYTPNTGLAQAASLTSSALGGAAVFAHDANDIDALVAARQPEEVIIEGLWVTPAKMAQIMDLHPQTKFTVRVHSKLDFLAVEGIAFQWLKEYGCNIASNHLLTHSQLTAILGRDVLYRPNIYHVPQTVCGGLPGLNISCFGASRPLKNQTVQAAAAIYYAEESGQQLTFHMNWANTQLMKSVRSLFHGPHVLIEHSWLPRQEFLELCNGMSVGMQVSLSETFNLVSADHVWQHTPVVVSKEVDWASSRIEDPTFVFQISEELDRVLNTPQQVVETQMAGLVNHNLIASANWPEL